MKIKKILNNNAVVVKNGNDEKIVMGLGIAFQKKTNDPIDKMKIEKIFVMKDRSQYEQLEQILTSLPVEHIQIAEEIISFAERELGVRINEHIHIALTDHLSFALDRLGNGVAIKNTLLQEIKILYPQEYGIGLHAKALIQEKLGIDIPEDEVGYIAVHIHTAKTHAVETAKTLDIASMIRDITEVIEQCLQVDLEEDSISYERLVTHLRIVVQRPESGERLYELGPEMVHIIKGNFKEAYACAVRAGRRIQEEHGLDLTDTDLAYMAVQIQRVINRFETD